MHNRLRWTAEGATAPVAESADGTTTLADGVTYYAELGGEADCALLGSVDYYWTSLVASITLEKTNHPTVAIAVATGTTSKWSADTATTITPAGNAQGRTELASPAALRYRARCAVGAVAGNGGAIEAWSVFKGEDY